MGQEEGCFGESPDGKEDDQMWTCLLDWKSGLFHPTSVAVCGQEQKQASCGYNIRYAMGWLWWTLLWGCEMYADGLGLQFILTLVSPSISSFFSN